MSVTSSSGKPMKAISGYMTYEGYWTGDHESACFADAIEPKDQTPESRQYPDFPGLDPTKKYRVEIQWTAQEIAAEQEQSS